RWAIRPMLIAGGLALFILYATWSAVFAIPYFGFEYTAQGYHSPFFGIDLGGALSLPAWLSPAILVLWIQVLFRGTCYYFRGAYYKAFFLDPPSCAVGEPSIHRRFAMENKFPFILQNAHRFALYLAFIPLVVLWWDLIVSMSHDGQFRLGLGVFLIAADAIFVSLYVGSCHSFRHLVGGSMDCFSCTAYTETRHGIWKWVSRLNVRHGTWAWLSLGSIVAVDLYVRALALDIINEATPVIGGFL
ncbi:MAG: succinate dehydrogenase, partial [Candidatus Limnocylindrales bacterium]